MENVCPCTHIWRTDVHIPCLPLSIHTLLLTKRLSLNLELTDCLSWLASQQAPVPGSQVHPTEPIFCMNVGYPSSVLSLLTKQFTH